MRLLLDTHLLLWAAEPSTPLSSQARQLITDPDNELSFSVASIWEIVIKRGRGRDDFQIDPRLLRRSLLDNEYREFTITGEHAAAIANLPPLHRDPFDRMLVAQSIVEGVILLTADPVVAQYPAPVRKYEEESMTKNTGAIVWTTAALLLSGIPGVVVPAGAQAQQNNMSFFVTSTGIGKGADLGGLEGADRHCQQLAQAAGAGNHTWHAYLSTQPAESRPAVNARDRIGAGPWRNAKGEIIANNLDELHGDNKLTKQTALSEKGEIINGRGDTPNRHDILTGSQPDGTAFPAGDDRTCHNWTSSTQGAAMLGHHDRMGLRDDAASHSWNSSHPSRGPEGGCSQADLRSTGGDGLLYCFAER